MTSPSRRIVATTLVLVATTAAGATMVPPAARHAVHASLAAVMRPAGEAASARAAETAAGEPWWSAALEPADRARLQQVMPNVPYDGRFTFVRLSYELPLSRFEGGFGGRSGACYSGRIAWLHDYPCAERNLSHILAELTAVRPYLDGGNILALDDPDLFKYPIAYMSEPGYWRPAQHEAAALREYLLKGGFIIFDDFGGRDWTAFEAGVRMALPEAELVRLDGSEPIFNSFFSIAPLESIGIPYRGGAAEWWGVYEDNDRSKRLMVVASYNNDLGDFWEYSGTGWYAMDMTNEALKVGVNYIIYAMVH
jgi:hypothetical protein